MSALLEQVSNLHLLGVALGAGLGAILRAGVDRTVVRRFGSTSLPWATLAVNVAGSLLLGLVLAVGSITLFADTPAQAVDAARTAHLVVGTGFCGGLTTFSTHSVESFLLILERRRAAAVGYAGLTMGLGMAAVILGTWLGDSLS